MTEINTGIRKSEEGHDEESDPVREGMLPFLYRGDCAPFPHAAEGNGGGEDDACQCRMKSRAEDAVPEDDAKHEVGDRTDVTDSVDVEKESRDRRCAKKVHPRKFLRVEESNDDDGHEIIHDGQSRQEDFHGYGNPGAQDGDDAYRKRDVGRRRDGPAGEILRIREIHDRVDDGRTDEPEEGPDARQEALGIRVQLAMDHFPFHFQSHLQEEDGHQHIIDP